MYMKSALFLWLFNFVSSQNRYCNYYQKVQAGNTYSVCSPNYPQNYSGGVQCRWSAECPAGYKFKLDCPEVNIPESKSCAMDRLLVSRTGDSQLTGAEMYCGRGTISLVSTGQRISMGLITAKNSTGGKFLCNLTTQQAT